MTFDYVTEGIMKYVLAAFTLLVVATGTAAAAQSTDIRERHTSDVSFSCSTDTTTPYDFTHRGAGSDKSDELGVAYYN